MNLKILLPTQVFLERPVTKVTAEGENGSFTLLPRHVDFLTALVPGILSHVSAEGKEEFVAVGEGILVKSGRDVLVSTTNAVGGVDLGKLREAAEEQFRNLDERERKVRTVLSRLEADIVRSFLQG